MKRPDETECPCQPGCQKNWCRTKRVKIVPSRSGLTETEDNTLQHNLPKLESKVEEAVEVGCNLKYGQAL